MALFPFFTALIIYLCSLISESKLKLENLFFLDSAALLYSIKIIASSINYS